VPDLLNEGGPYVARESKTPVMRMPQQHVREGRGTVGYKSTDEAKVETFKTDAPASLKGSGKSKATGSRKAKADADTGGTIAADDGGNA
jgi:hypothetical protein